jgi:predicted phage-related endonuclease
MSGVIDRRRTIGGSDARVIMSDDQAALLRLWREKRGEIEPEDLTDNLIVQLGTVTEELNRRWYQRNTGHEVGDVQQRITHPVHRWMTATLDGRVEATGAVFEAKFMLPWSFSEEAAAEKHMAQLQHNMWVSNAKSAALSIIKGGGKWAEVLALCGDGRAPSPVRDRAAAGPDRGGQNGRHERLQCLGRVCKPIPGDPRRCR